MSEHKITLRVFSHGEKHKTVFWIFSTLIFLLLAAGAIWLIFHWDDISLDGIRRKLAYLDVSGNTESEMITFDKHSSNVYASTGNGLTVASVSGATVFNEKGETAASSTEALATPAVLSGDDVSLAYDIGGTTLIALNGNSGEVQEIHTDGRIFDADISDENAICYCAEEDGKKTVMTVLNGKQKEIYKWYSSSAYLTCCAVQKNGETVSAVGLGQENHVFQSTLMTFDTETEDAPQTTDLGSLLVYDLAYLKDGTLCVVGDSAAEMVDKELTVAGSCDYAGRYLKGYCFGEDYICLSLNEYQAGSHYYLQTFGSDGTEWHEQYIGEEILSLTAAGKYIAVLTVSGLTVYTSDLTVYSETDEIESATEALARDDGTVMLISGNTVSLYIP